MCADLLGGPKGPVPSGLGIVEDAFMNTSSDKQLKETLHRFRKLSKGFRSDYMGTFTKPRDKQHLNDLLYNHNQSIRKKAPVRSASTPSFSTIMAKDKEFSANVEKLKRDFFKEQKETDKVSRGKR